jgi:hypothetical protein
VRCVICASLNRASHLAFLRWAAILALTVFIPFQVNAQVVGGTVQGTITDPSGATLPGVQIDIENLSTAIRTSVTSNGDGFYTAPNLLPGDYRLTATREGFTSTTVSFTLTVGAQHVVNLTLRVGGVTDTIRVSNDAPNVELGSSEISDAVNATTIRELPLNGRDWTQLATLQPGVATIRTQPSVGAADRGQRGFGTQMTIDGGRPAQNNYRLDGVSINDYSNSGPGSVLGANLGSDAISEFSVLSSNYPAQYGRTSGGVINAITRSGGNQFHGSVYEFLRNSALDASNFFDTVKPAFKRNQFGATAGGPLWKDHTFIFGNYEGLRQSLGITQIDNVPTATARTGQLSTGNVTVDPAVVPYLPIWPLPNQGCVVTPPPGTLCDIGIYQFSGQQITPENYFTTRVDHKLSANDTLFSTFMRDTAHILQPDELNAKLTGYTTGRHLITIEENHVFNPRLVNAVRFGYNRVVGLIGQTFKATNPLAANISLGFAPGLPPGEIDVGGLTNFSGGLGGISNYNFHWNSFQGYDDAFLTLGKHAMKFGVAVERIQENMSASDSPNGLYLFDSLSNFLTNNPTSLSVHVGTTGGPRYVRQTIVGGYMQDDIQALSNLTVNLGLRYEMVTVPTEIHGKLASLRNLTDATYHTGNPYYSNATLRNFEPRIGFSWDPFKNGKTAVRSGFGMFDVLPLSYETQNLTLFTAPFYLLGSAANLPTGTFPNAYQYLQNVTNALLVNYIEPHPARSYTMAWNLNIQGQLSQSVAVMIGYVGSHGVHLPFRIEDMNTALPIANTPQGYLWSGDPTPPSQVNPNFGWIEGLQWSAASSYHALQAQIKKNMSHGLQAQASFTWSKSIDTSSSGSIGDNFHNAVSSLPFFDPRLNRGLSDFNLGKNLVVNYEWEIPAPKSVFSAARWALGGWQLGGIFEISTGVPFSVVDTGDPLRLGNLDPFARPDRISGPGCSNPVNPGQPDQYIKLQCFALSTPPSSPSLAAQCISYPGPLGTGLAGTCTNRLGNSSRNQLIGPGLTNFDMSLFKNIPIKKEWENFKAQFRVEVFNIFNHPNFSPPIDHNQIFDGSGIAIPGAGAITTTVTPSRQIQFGLKISW